MESFQIDAWALFLSLVFLGFCLLLSRRYGKRLHKAFHLKFSFVGFLNQGAVPLRVRLVHLPRYLRIFALVMFCLALADPRIVQQVDQENSSNEVSQEDSHKQIEETTLPVQGLGLYLILDQSGSMGQEGFIQAADGSRVALSRLEILKRTTRRFLKGDGKKLEGRKLDLIGLVSFARTARVLVPLTFDQNFLLDQLAKLNTVQDREEDGTAIGYAIFKTLHLMLATQHYAEDSKRDSLPSYDIQGKVMILVTDGLQNPNPLDQEHRLRPMGVREAAQKAAENGVRLYIVGIEPKIRDARFHQYNLEMRKAAEMTGGKYFIADDPEGLEQIYEEIDSLEKTWLPQGLEVTAEVEEIQVKPEEEWQRLRSYTPLLLLAGLVSLALSIILECTYLRRFP